MWGLLDTEKVKLKWMVVSQAGVIYPVLPAEGSLLKLIESMHLYQWGKILLTLAVNVHKRASVVGIVRNLFETPCS